MKRLVPWAVLTMFLLASLLQTLRIVVTVGDTRQLDYGEGIVLWQASQVFNLKSAFHPLQQYPHIVFHYTPLYHVALRAMAAVVGDLLVSGRLVSMLAGFWLVGLFVWVVFRATRGYATAGVRWFGAVFSGACVLLVPSMQWDPLARVDMLGLALQFTAFSVICVRPWRLRNQIAAFCLLLLGLYTKQSLLSIPAASILLIGLIRPLRAFWLTCALAAAGLCVLLGMALATGGSVIRHWILYNVNPFHLRDAVFSEFVISMNMAALIAIGVTTFCYTLPSADGRRSFRRAMAARLALSPLRRTGVGFGLVAAIGFVVSWGIGKEGANFNYCLDWQLALCPLTGTFIVMLARKWQRRDSGVVFLRVMVSALLGVTGVMLLIQAYMNCNHEYGLSGVARGKILASRREDMDLVRLISTFPGPVVSENMTALLQAGKAIPFEPAIIQQTTATGIFDETELVRKTTDGFFDAFVFINEPSHHFFSPRMLEAIHQRYKLYPWAGESYIVYVRR